MAPLLRNGGPVLWLLVALSILVVGRAIERWLFWRSVHAGRHVPSDAQKQAGLRLFTTTVAAAPMLGILGTVLGMIDVLGVLDASRTPDPLELSGGVAQALTTTAAGLVTALVALVAGEACAARVEDDHCPTAEAAGRRPTGSS